MHVESKNFRKIVRPDTLLQTDPELGKIIQSELERQEYGLEMIASENYVSASVLEAQGSVLTNKYAEGYPGKRYYGGCEFVDQAETLAIERAKKIFAAEHANVQPHSGSQANMAVFLAAAKPGSKIMGMNLSHGGHLTHGSPVNFSGFLYQTAAYGLDEKTSLLNYDQINDIAKKEKPQILIAGYSAYPRILDFKSFREIADNCGALLVTDMAHFSGLVAAGIHPSPIPYSDYVTSTTHKTLRGPRGGLILCSQERAKDINSKIFPGIQGGPLEHVIAAKAVAFGEILRPEFKTYAEQIVVNAKALAKVFLERGFHLVTGGTDNHLILMDLSQTPQLAEKLTGKDGENALGKAGITVNKNTVPNEKRSPFITSGLRIGTPALTTRGMGAPEMQQIGVWICDVLENHTNETLLNKIHLQIKDLCKRFPIYAQ